MSQKLPHSEFQVIALYLESIIEATHLLVGIRERKWGMIITKRKRKMEPTGYDGFWYWRPSSILLQGLTTENKETSSQVRTQPSALWKAKSLLDPLLSTVGGHGLRLTLEWRFPILFMLFGVMLFCIADTELSIPWLNGKMLGNWAISSSNNRQVQEIKIQDSCEQWLNP